ncbi:MAG TPA: endolytic transglycosylase MltG [bacterium]|nr:endolytic transglycosylase MltG [bacterium]
MKKFIIIFVAVIIATVSLIKFGMFRTSLYGDMQPAGTLVEIPKNMSGMEIALLLKEKGIIKNTHWFLRVLTKKHIDGKLRAGIYEFTGKPYLYDVIEKLEKGDIAYRKLVFPEGITCHEIGIILEQEGICTCNEFDTFSKTKGLEGYLFPDTYHFPINVSKEAVARKMIERFWEIFQQITPDASKLKKDELAKIVIIASIVEKEAQNNAERPIIAGIFYNRLKRKMPLQSCSTIKYVIGNKKNLTNSDIHIKTPYNTYIHKGLPPGPICNPGKESLKAAAYPAKTPYLFFVSKGDGTHYFSTTYSEHLNAKHFYIDNHIESETEKQT